MPAVRVLVGGMSYSEAVVRARDVERLDQETRNRVLDQLQIGYPEQVATVLEDLLIPKGAELPRPDLEVAH